MTKEIYNNIYKTDRNYNNPEASKSEDKYQYVSNFIRDYSFILDVGCGSGFNLRKMMDAGKYVFGIDISEVCCDTYLQDIPHKCTDIVSFNCPTKFDAIICCDVLEHIELNDLDKNVSALLNLSDNVLFGIANHSDIWYNEELHLIQENKNWWIKRLLNHYSCCELVAEILNTSFFFLKCSK